MTRELPARGVQPFVAAVQKPPRVPFPAGAEVHSSRGLCRVQLPAAAPPAFRSGVAPEHDGRLASPQPGLRWATVWRRVQGRAKAQPPRAAFLAPAPRFRPRWGEPAAGRLFRSSPAAYRAGAFDRRAGSPGRPMAADGSGSSAEDSLLVSDPPSYPASCVRRPDVPSVSPMPQRSLRCAAAILRPAAGLGRIPERACMPCLCSLPACGEPKSVPACPFDAVRCCAAASPARIRAVLPPRAPPRCVIRLAQRAPVSLCRLAGQRGRDFRVARSPPGRYVRPFLLRPRRQEPAALRPAHCALLTAGTSRPRGGTPGLACPSAAYAFCSRLRMLRGT